MAEEDRGSAGNKSVRGKTDGKGSKKATKPIKPIKPTLVDILQLLRDEPELLDDVNAAEAMVRTLPGADARAPADAPRLSLLALTHHARPRHSQVVAEMLEGDETKVRTPWAWYQAAAKHYSDGSGQASKKR